MRLTGRFRPLLASCAVGSAADPPSVPPSSGMAPATTASPADPPLHDPLLPPIFLAARSAIDPAVIRALADAGAGPSAWLAPGYRASMMVTLIRLHAIAPGCGGEPRSGCHRSSGCCRVGRARAKPRQGTPLHAAWNNPNPAVVQAPLRSGANPLARDEWNCPAMTDTFPLVPTKEVCHGGKKARAVSARV